MKKSILVLFFLFLGIQSFPEFPKPRGLVSDFAGVISAESSDKMNAVIGEIEQKTGAEIAVVAVKTTETQPLETYAVKLFEKWGIGKKGKNNGVMLIASINDRKVRIEVGYGLEGILTDGLTGEILDKYVIPYFKNGDYGRGLLEGTIAIAGVIAEDAGIKLPQKAEEKRPSMPLNIFKVIFFIILFFLFIRHPFLFLLFLNMSSGNRFGGGGFGGSSRGGFGGFGGGFSGGGGSSRGW